MSDSEEESCCFYGKPLEQYDEDSIPKRKPISVEDQIATDSHGRRRFHGAFTGGFSAGFYNTVGSLEGWKPSEFKSSRAEKAQTKKASKPEDFMDDEDMGEHGIAPQIIRATSDYATGKKRKKAAFSEGPIPGIPVLHSLIEAGNETIGYLLMKNMDLRSRSKGPETIDEGPKVYGCEMPKAYEIQRNVEKDDIIPKVYLQYLKSPKDNTFGLGYVGLDKSELSLRQSTQLVVRDQNNRKLAISGQAFGVGAFEKDDEDIYAKDDMTQYDFEITKEKSKKNENKNLNHPEFVLGSEKLLNYQSFPAPVIPHSFTGKHKVKRSRFEPVPSDKEEVVVDRRDMNAAVRAKYLGEDLVEKGVDKIAGGQKRANEKVKEESKLIKKEPNDDKGHVFNSDLIFGKFVSASLDENPHDILQRVEPTYTEHGTKEMRDAAKLNMYGPLTRVVIDWLPCSLLCKRFNVREPIFDDKIKKEPRRKNQILFEYQKDKDESAPLLPGLKTTKQAVPEEEGDVNNDPNLNNVRPSTSFWDDTTPSTSNSTTSETNSISHLSNFTAPPPNLTSQTPQKIIEIQQSIPSLSSETKEDIQPEEKMETDSSTRKIIFEETDKIDVGKNIDMFKAVFLSSDSESEDEAEKEEEVKKKDDLMKANVLSEEFIPKIRPSKQGILSNIKFNPLFKNVSKDEEQAKNGTEKITDAGESIEKDEKREDDANLYGPKLPVSIEKVEKVFSLPKVKVDDEWIEKDEVTRRKSHKHKKKHKKEKHHKRDKEKKKYKK